MADTVRTPTFPKDTPPSVKQIIWSGLDGDDTGTPVKLGQYTDMCVHIYAASAFGGSTVTVEGSNDPRANPADSDHANAEWVTLADAQGNAISKTAAAIETILDNTMWVRPKTASGTGADVVVNIVARKTV